MNKQQHLDHDSSPRNHGSDRGQRYPLSTSISPNRSSSRSRSRHRGSSPHHHSNFPKSEKNRLSTNQLSAPGEDPGNFEKRSSRDRKLENREFEKDSYSRKPRSRSPSRYRSKSRERHSHSYPDSYYYPPPHYRHPSREGSRGSSRIYDDRYYLDYEAAGTAYSHYDPRDYRKDDRYGKDGKYQHRGESEKGEHPHPAEDGPRPLLGHNQFRAPLPYPVQREREREREKEKPVTTGFQSDWKDLCSQIYSVWSTFNSGFLSAPTKQWSLIPVKKLYIRTCYNENLEKLKEKRSQLNSDQTLKLAYIGTSGIGKSGFLQLLLIYLVHEAKEKGVVYTVRLSVFQSERKPPQDWTLRTDGRCSYYNDERVDYYLSDSVDISSLDLSNVRIACVLATSEKSTESKQFEKLPGRILIPMPVWSYEELLKISPFSQAESDIRYAIFGGSARHFLGSGSDFPVSKPFDYVSETMNWFFEEEKTAKVLSEKQWNEICEYLVQCLSSSNNKERDSTRIAVKALMWHTDDCQEFFYASRFMAMLAQHILNQHESSLKEALRSVVTASGIGYCFEYLGHKEMLHGSHCFKVNGKGQGTAGFIWNLPQLTLKKFRRQEDIASLKLGTYGIPYRSNFPLIDCVVQPDTLINFTISKIHKGANAELENLRGYLLEKDRKKHKFIWMVEDAEDFKKQEDLGDIKQYAMCYVDARN